MYRFLAEQQESTEMKIHIRIMRAGMRCQELSCSNLESFIIFSPPPSPFKTHWWTRENITRIIIYDYSVALAIYQELETDYEENWNEIPLNLWCAAVDSINDETDISCARRLSPEQREITMCRQAAAPDNRIGSENEKRATKRATPNLYRRRYVDCRLARPLYGSCLK